MDRDFHVLAKEGGGKATLGLVNERTESRAMSIEEEKPKEEVR